jgi:hypothetical protein
MDDTATEWLLPDWQGGPVEVESYTSVRFTTMDEVAASVKRIEEKLAALIPPPALLSRRAFAKALGVSRNKTLGEIMTRYNVRTVKVRGALRIPLSEVERIQRVGDSPSVSLPMGHGRSGTTVP